MPLGFVTHQVDPDHFTFTYTGPPFSTVLPGEFVVVDHLGASKTLALVESYSGNTHADPLGTKTSYESLCKIVGSSKLLDLVGCPVDIASDSSLQGVLDQGVDPKIELGEFLHRDNHITVTVQGQNLLGTHSCFFGDSGFGKSTFLGLVIEGILENISASQVIVFDLNSDFAAFNYPRDPKAVNENVNCCKKLDPGTLKKHQTALAKTPMRFEKQVSVSIARFTPRSLFGLMKMSVPTEAEILLDRIFKILTKSKVPVSVRSCLNQLHRESLKKELDAITADHSILLLSKSQIEQAKPFVNSLLEEFAFSQFWSNNHDDSLGILTQNGDLRFIQFDLGNMPYTERALFIEVALGIIWERNEKQKTHTFVVIDEAHNVVPTLASDQFQERSRNMVNRFSAEGRKFGLFLFLVSQRPSKIHPNTLDNCQNYFVLRIQNRDDLEFLHRASSEVSSHILSRVSNLHPHSVLAWGKIGPPVFLRTGRRKMK